MSKEKQFEPAGAGLQRPTQSAQTLCNSDQAWLDSGTPGFLIKPLFEDAGSGQRTWLMKVEPGAYSPPHEHEQLEQIYMIEGEFSDGSNTYRAGDFLIRAPGVEHEASSENGALMLLIYST